MGSGRPPTGQVVPSGQAALAEPLIARADTHEAVIRLDDLAGMDFLARVPSRHELILDTDAGTGGPGRGIQPKEILLVALAEPGWM
jgi:hypothetical protein